MYTTYLPQKTASFLRMRANLFSFIFCYFHSLPTTFLSPPLCSLQPSFPRGSPHHFSPDDPFAEPTAPVALATQPRSPCDICCVGTWLTGAFQLLSLKQTIGQRPYFILLHTVIALSKMAFDKYWLNKYSFNRPNNLAKDIWNKTASYLGNTITCKAGSF